MEGRIGKTLTCHRNGWMLSVRSSGLKVVIALSLLFTAPYAAGLAAENYSGIGIHTRIDGDTAYPYVVDVMHGGPAEKAGIKAGDIITNVNGESTKGLTMDNDAAMIRGEEGSIVRLFIEREGTPFRFSITRSILHNPTSTSSTEQAPMVASDSVRGSMNLCNTIGLDIVGADSALMSAVVAAVNAGGNDTQVLAGSNARYGGAFKAVEDDAVTISDAFHQGLDQITNATIAVDALTLPEEKKFALSSIQSYSDALNFVNRFGCGSFPSIEMAVFSG